VVEHQRARLVRTLAASQHLVVEVECSPTLRVRVRERLLVEIPAGVRRCCASIRNGRTTLIANKLGCSHMTVADVRTELETTSQIGQLDRHLGEDLKWRKVKRKAADWPHKALQDPAEKGLRGAAVVIDRVTLVPEDGLPAMLAFSANRKRSARDGAIWKRNYRWLRGRAFNLTCCSGLRLSEYRGQAHRARRPLRPETRDSIGVADRPTGFAPHESRASTAILADGTFLLWARSKHAQCLVG
jgi:hypothetical protein